MTPHMLANFVNAIAPSVSPLQGNTIEDDERVSFGVVCASNVGNSVDAVDWTDSIIERCRFDSTTISNSSFERVAILDCDLSGVTFSNCLLRECLIMGVKANFNLALDNCILDRVIIARSRTDRFDIHNSRIVDVEFLGIESTHLNFHQCQAHKLKGRVSFEDCDIRKIGGLEAMAKQGVSVHVDAPMWRNLGDHYLSERGIQQLDAGAPGKAAASYGLLDEIGEGLGRYRF